MGKDKLVKLTQLPRECRFMEGDEIVDWCIDNGFDGFIVDRLPNQPVIELCDLWEKWASIRHLMA